MKRSLQLVLAVLVAVAGLGLAAAPSGAVAPPKAKAFTVAASPASSVWSQTVKLTASLTPKGGGVPKGGTITFLSDGVSVGTATATTRNTVLTTSTLAPGDHAITASYSGDVGIAPGPTTNSAPVTVGAAATAISVAPTQDPVPWEDPAEIKAVVRAVAPAVPTRRPTGTVTFTASGCITGTVNLNTNGVATWRPWLCPGHHDITAVYNGSDKHAASTEPALSEVTVIGPGGEDEENIDEVNEGEPAGFVIIYDDSETSTAYAQTITPTRTGRIYAVDLLGLWFSENETPPGPLQVSIQPLDDETGDPTGSMLGVGWLDPSEVEEGVGGPIHLDLDSQADVEGGVSYAIVLEVGTQEPDAFGTWLMGTSGADDDPGDLNIRRDGGDWENDDDPDADLLFRTHLGDPV
ncbi:MAG TPA: Ig-like domain-containing protein [Iamia sp.]|nr:Ig-like domain-containing protein [Iamia sp.]